MVCDDLLAASARPRSLLSSSAVVRRTSWPRASKVKIPVAPRGERRCPADTTTRPLIRLTPAQDAGAFAAAGLPQSYS